METESSVVCPVCTLYLRPGITLKSHLGSHPKQKVIEALVRLAADSSGALGKELLASKSNELMEYAEDNVIHSGQNTPIMGQQWAPNGPIGLNTAAFAPIPGNHSIIYQQFVTSAAAAAAAATSTTNNHHNLLQLQHHQQQPYVIFNSGQHPAAAAAATALHPNHLTSTPYVFHQQQQLIMSSTSTAAAAPPAALTATGILQNGHQFQMLPSAATGSIVIGRNQHQQQLIALLPQPEKIIKTIFEMNVGEDEDVLDEPDIATLENDGPTSVCVTISTPSENRSDLELKSSTILNMDIQDITNAPINQLDVNGIVDISQQNTSENNICTAEEEEDGFLDEIPLDVKASHADMKCHSPNIEQEELQIDNDYDSYTKGGSDNEYEDEDCVSFKSESSQSVKIRNDLNNTSKETQTCSDMGTDGGESNLTRSLSLNPPTAFFISEENTTGINVECSEYITLQNSNAATEQGLYCNRLDDDKDGAQNSRPTIDTDGMNLIINNEFLPSHGISNIETFDYGKASPNRSNSTKIIPQPSSTSSVLRPISPLCPVVQHLHNNTAAINRSTIVRASPVLTATTSSSMGPVTPLTPTTNIRTDERMPPRGELSGQESSNASDVTAWIQMAQYREEQDAPGLLGIYSRNANHWNDSPDTSDCEDERARPLPTSYPAQKQRYSSTMVQPTTTSAIAEVPIVTINPDDYVDDTPTVSGYSDPPIQYKCPNCPQVFNCRTERRTHQRLVHSDSNTTGCLIMNGTQIQSSILHSESPINNNALAPATVAKKPIKKLQIKPKQKAQPLKEVKAEANFDNVFTNKLKMEMEETAEPPQPITTTAPSISSLKHELDQSKQLTATAITSLNGSVLPPPPIIVHSLKEDDWKTTTTCLLCDITFPDADKCRDHLSVAHADITASIVLPAAAITRTVASNAKYKCATCAEMFATEAKYTLHLKIHPLECRYCGRYFYRRANLQLHHKRHLGIKPHKCTLCEKSFFTKQKLDEHTNVHTGENPIKCNLCGESFRRHSNLVQHRKKHHLKLKPKIKDFICDCGLIFHSAKKMAWHAETHEKRPKSCTQCSEKFVHATSLTRHMRRAHNDRFLPQNKRTEENVECPICKGIYLKASLDVHIKNHSGARPFACTICKKDFTTKWNLKLHKWTHAARISKPFKCEQCKGAFVRESDYIAHMNSHKALRPYTCNYCGAQFIRKYNCQRHVKEHEKDKTYSCEICNKTFHRSYYLKDHMRVHSGARPFSCHICGKGSTTKSNHNKHVRIHHAREPISTEN